MRTPLSEKKLQELIEKIEPFKVGFDAIGEHVIITDESQIDEDFFRVKREPDKKAIKEALEVGINVRGAEMSNGGETLSIRVN